MNADPAIDVRNVTFHYGQRRALNNVSFDVRTGEFFALVGPNGGGKTTLFRLLSTLVPLQQGEVEMLGFEARDHAGEIRARLGVVFQAPSVDQKLTVRENLHHQGHLYGLGGHELRQREEEMLAELGLSQRANELVEKLSGGLRRRVELAKGMLHRPQVLLLDEPSTGLDPGARNDLWAFLERLRQSDGITILLTTHLLDEAGRADRVAIIDEGALVALDTPDSLKATVGGDTITIETDDPRSLAADIKERFDLAGTVIGDSVRLERPDAHRWITELVEAFPGRIRAITLGKPTLEDVFIARTGHRFWADGAALDDSDARSTIVS